MKRLGGMIVALLVALALAAPAAAQSPADAWAGWTWSSVVERLAGWAGGVLQVFGASGTEGDEGDGVAVPLPEEPISLLDAVPEEECESFPKIDPDG